MLYEVTLQSLRNLRFRNKEKVNRITVTLNERYAECNSQGHLGPDEEDVCQHCYRHYESKLDMGEITTEERMGIELQRMKDHFTGLMKIAEQLETRSVS